MSERLAETNVYYCSPLLDCGTGTFLDGDTCCAGMDPHGTLLSCLAFGSDFLQVDDELVGVVLGVGQQLGGIQSQDMVGDGVWAFGKEVGVIFFP